MTGLFARETMGGDRDFDKASLKAQTQRSFGEHTVSVGVQGGTSLDTELPTYAQFTLGGPFVFAGLSENQFRGSEMGVASLSYRYRIRELPSQLGRGIYTITRLDVGNVWADNIDMDDLRYGSAYGISFFGAAS